jgi:eukaryotic-like serine/threonine-protein kinase
MAAPLLAGRYRLQDILSSTRMAEVWRALDAELDRRVVVKLLAPGADRERFEREARAVAALGHPNIVQLFDFGEEERWYMVFEYLPGGSLEERLAEVDALSPDDVARIADDVAAGLAHAHERGVIHRDLKPANVLFDSEGRAKIADFGIARVVGADTLTDPGTVLGTAAYISPEQVRGEESTPASDVYAFGVLLYRMLTGRHPFDADNPTELAALHRDEDPRPLQQVRADAPSTLSALAMSCLAKEAAARPRDGSALVHTLDGNSLVARAEDATAIIARGPARARRRVQMPLIAAFSVMALTALGVLAALVFTSREASAPATPLHTSQASHTARPPTTLPITSGPRTTSSTTATTSRQIPPQTTSNPATTTPPPQPQTNTTSPVTTTPDTTQPTTSTP